MTMVREVDEQDRIFLYDPHQQDQADQAVHIDGLMKSKKA